jgi:hypothetical protein
LRPSSHALIGIDAQVEAAQDRLVAIAHRGEVQRDQRRAQLVRIGKVEAERGIVDHLGDGLQLGERLLARLRLLGGGGTRGLRAM